MTQIALADALEVDRAYVSALERRKRNPTVVTLFRIAVILGVSFSKLFEIPDGQQGPTKALVVPKKSGLPGPGYDGSLIAKSDHHKALIEVRKHKWAAKAPF